VVSDFTQTSVASTRVRWWILSLLFFATTINYLDRILFSVLYTTIRDDLHIDALHYGYINGAFSLTYMVGFLFMGKFIDRYGTRIGYAVSLIWWSLAAALHAFATSGLSLGFWRGMLGLGESGNFPAAIKSVAEWFPKKDRAFATGIFNAGTNVASMVGPPMFLWIAMLFASGEKLNWRAAFLITSSLGFVWLIFWLLSYRPPDRHPAVNKAELEYIHSDAPESQEAPITWIQALGYKQTWGFALAKFLSDPVWWFYLYWLPPYLQDARGFKLSEVTWALPVVYLLADVGSVGGGWISGFLIRRGWPNGKARKATMLLFACTMPVAAMGVLVDSPILTIALVCLATSSHQGWSANLFTTTSDVFPKNATASVTGIGGCLGGLGGFLFSSVLAGLIVHYVGYTPMFLFMGCFHLSAFLVVHFLLGDMRRIEGTEVPESRLRKIRVALYAVAGGVAGLVVAFFVRPAAPQAGQLALDTVVTRGLFLQEAQAALIPTAQASFNYLMVGLFAGALIAAMFRHLTSARR
jgi:ACS family hexuronate transporter-like MFS transporter